MYQAERVTISIQDDIGNPRGHIEIQLLPGAETVNVPPLLDRRDDPDLEPGTAGVQLLEGHEYRYIITLDDAAPRGNVSTDRPEVFRPDTRAGLSGRVRPGLYTGTLPVNLLVDGQHLGSFQVEVRASKLDYLSHYRWMLRDLADTFAEVIMRRFAPTETRFTFRADAGASTLYQRFAFLRSIMGSEPFEAAITHILSHPHQEWREEAELRPAGQPIPHGPGVARAVARSGPRVPWRRAAAALNSLPARMPVRRSFGTYDTLPNRFVKHVLVEWRNTVASIQRALAQAPESATTKRGLAEAAGVLAHLDEVLAHPFFRKVGPLTQPRLANQVLQKRAGYRDVYRLYVQSEMAAMLAWSGGEDVYRAGQKDVAVLYEYWVFVQLALIVSEMCCEPLRLERLVEAGPDGLDLRLKRGTHRVLRGTVERRDRRMQLELWYNRTFSQGDRYESWTRGFRPDCSLCIRMPGYGNSTDELWLHFDAKYRVDSLLEIFGDNVGTALESGDRYLQREIRVNTAPSRERESARPVTDDLLKMHAYRDAIRRSSGAYIIYPGTEVEVHRRYHEILPGLGAFALRPSANGLADGIDAIRQFIDAVMDHAGTQLSQHERYRYWKHAIFAEAPPRDIPIGVRAVPFLTRPPADTRVLLGYVRDNNHYQWIIRTRLYNMRADQRTGSVGLGSQQLAAEIVVLYGPTLERATLWRVNGDPRLMTQRRMLECGYPEPRSSAYYCLPVEPIGEVQATSNLTYPRAVQLAQELSPGSSYGAPIATTWARLMEMLAVQG